jgi:DNA repair protein RecN (Recombination protein N)
VLRELTVQNLATIEDARLELEPGMLVWTGETGAGKSLLLSALGLVLGAKASTDLVRSGKDEARAAAVFELTSQPLRDRVEATLGGPLEDSQLILLRRVGANGRSQSHVNGMPVTNTTLRRLGECLIDIQGQHEGQALLEPEHQLRLVDAYGRLESEVATYREAREAHEALRKRRLALLETAEHRRRERDLLQFELDELVAVSPRSGEFDTLLNEAHRLAHADSFREATRAGYLLLNESEGSAQERLTQAARRIAPAAEVEPELAAVAADLRRLAEETRELARQLYHASERIDDDPRRLEQVEERLALYRKLATRFRCTPDDLEAKRQAVAEQLGRLEQDDTDQAGLHASLVRSWSVLREAAGQLSDARNRVGSGLARAIQAQFKGLNLGQARISVAVEAPELGDDPTSPAPPEHGAERLEILFAPNPGEPPRPLRKIASGGELSRVTLAVKTVLADFDEVPTVIFDEVDSGVGGRLGAVLGRLLKGLARRRQVLCITHLPQLACHARHHWVVRKATRRGRSHTAIHRLEETERVAELAAMLRGETAGESTRREAQAMLAEARAIR